MYTVAPNNKVLTNCTALTMIVTQASPATIENELPVEQEATPQNAPDAILRSILQKKNILLPLPAIDGVTRFFDIVISLSGLIIFLPLFLLIAFIIKISSRGPAIFTQKRAGKNGTDFTLYKFRTMYAGSAKQSSLTIGKRDTRITAIGYFLRRYKLDELPQLFNVLKSDMSIVGPRPEVRKYVNLYSEEQRQILLVKPGITDYASILFRNENELLALQPYPEKHYIETVVPIKIRLNKKYVNNKTLKNYFIIILITFISVFK